MSQDRLDSFYNSKVDRYDRFNRIPEAASLVDAKTEPQDQTADRQIMVALGFIATLLLISGTRLYYCVNLKSAKTQISNPNQELALGDRFLAAEEKIEKLGDFARDNGIESLAITNTVSQGKF